MEQEAAREEADKIWQQKQQDNQAREKAKTSKNQKRREKAKERKAVNKTGAETEQNSALAKKLQPRTLPKKREDEDNAETMSGAVASPSMEEQGIVVHDDNT